MPNQQTFIDEIPIDIIQESKFDGISYQDVRRDRRGNRAHHSTSFFIQKNFLLTSAHNVTELFLGSRKPNRLSIYPSRIGDNLHRGSIIYDIDYDQNIRLAPSYRFMRRRTRIPHDIALIYVPNEVIDQNEELNTLPFLSILEDMSTLRRDEPVYCAGYPAADDYKGAFKMTLDESNLGRVRDFSFQHRLDTKRGNSGSPIMVRRDGEYKVIGVNSIRYSGTLINDSKKAWIERSIREMSDERN